LVVGSFIVSFDADRHQQNLARWASEDLAWFGVKGWPRSAGSGGSGIGWTDGGVQRTVRMSISAGFEDADGRRIEVTSHRQDDDGFAMLRDWAPRNTSLAADRASGKDVGGRRRRRAPRQYPQVDWQKAAVVVDGEAVVFEVCHFDGGFWAAVGRVTGADVTIDSRGVPLDGLQLERILDPPPEIHAPPSPPPQASERFPDELRDAALSVPVPPAAVVDLVYRSRSRLTGQAGGGTDPSATT
jgi:hypothetical protein